MALRGSAEGALRSSGGTQGSGGSFEISEEQGLRTAGLPGVSGGIWGRLRELRQRLAELRGASEEI